MTQSYGQNEIITLGQNDTTNTNVYTINTNNVKKEKKETEYDILINNNFKDEELKETIYEFIKMRKSIKKPLTTRGLELMIKNLYKLSTDVHEQIEILNNSIMNNWQGIFPLKKDNVYINRNDKKQETFEEQVERYKREWGIEDED
jgi:hypothetical protein